MNAEEARKASQGNGERVAKLQIEKAIKDMEREIKSATEKGLFEAKIGVFYGTPWVKANANTTVRQYFQAKGYEFNFDFSPCNLITLRCYWGGEQ